MYGDFEAHRHWMEITTNLPVGDWYRFDLQYWGLDYPPLMAYMSWFFGKVSERFVPGMVELGRSRGRDDADTKAFMRCTVLVTDCLVLLPVILYLSNNKLSNSLKTLWRSPLLPLASLLAPGLLLVDHGHFQYNGLCIALAIAAAALVAADRDVLGSALFCLSLNTKQMALYYAPVFFFALLRKCFVQPSWRSALGKLLVIGGTVLGCFGVLWAPFCMFPADGETCISSLGHVLSRQFPFSRGIFEDKVANVWYALSVALDVRQLLSHAQLLTASLALTLLLLSPVAYLLLSRPASLPHLSLAMVNSALAFFLASFQVHEKSILLALLPASTLVLHDPGFCQWLELVGCFTMFPLLRRDGLVVPYAALCLLYALIMDEIGRQTDANSNSSDALWPLSPPWLRHPVPRGMLQGIRRVSYAAMLALHVAEACIAPPQRYPDLYPALFALCGCGSFLLAYLLGICWQFTLSAAEDKDKDKLGKAV